MRRLLLGVIAIALACSAFAQVPPCAEATPQIPANGATGIETQPTFKWASVASATQYDIYFAKKSQQSCSAAWPAPNGTVNAPSVTFNPPQLDSGTEYIWRVVAKNLNCAAPTSATSCATFTTSSCPTIGPTLIEPLSGTIPFGNVTFKWNPVANATSYELFVSLNNGSFQGNTVSASTNSKSVAIGMGQHIAWYVVAKASSCPDRESTRASFDTSCATAVPTLLAPARGATLPENQKVDFKWTSVNGARGYSLYVTSDGGQTVQTLANNISATQFSATLPKGTWGWSVAAIYENSCPPGMSEGDGFVITSSPCPSNPGRAALISPANGTKNLTSPVTFQWNAVNSATSYRVLYGLNNATPIDLGTTTQTTLTANVPAGDGYWLVQTYFGDNCSSTLSDRASVGVISGASCNNAAPQLISPANGTTTTETKVKFEWSKVSNAINYLLFVSVDGGDYDLYGSTENTSIEKLLPAGSIRWLVAATFAGCPETRSAVSTFEAGQRTACPGGTIAITLPANGASVTSPVRATWNAVDQATAYRVWIAIGNEASAIVSRTTLTTADLTLPAGEASLYVDALFAGDCPPVTSPTIRFTVKQGADCGNNKAPLLVRPIDDAKVSNDVRLEWAVAQGAVAYRVWIAHENGAFEDLGITRDTHIDRTLGAGEYNWFVQAIFENCPPLASDKAKFEVEDTKARCSGAAPSILSPANGATLSSPVTITWSSVDDASKYRVLIKVDDDEAAFTTTETTLTKALPPGHAQVAVEAIFDECPSTFSPRVSFEIEAAQNCSNEKAHIVQPANGANVTSPLDVAWDPVSGAIRYVLFARLGEGNPTAVGETTDTHLSRKVPPGSLELWVLTLFRGCDPTESEHIRVNVQAPPECNNRAPVLLLPASDAHVKSRVVFAWTKVPHAARYRVWAWQDDDEPSIVATTQINEAVVELQQGPWKWFAEAQFASCPPTASAESELTVGGDTACAPPAKPRAQVVGQAISNSSYTVRWTPLANVSRYELQESSTADFADALTLLVDGTSRELKHEATHVVQQFYRVRGVGDCTEETGLYSDVVAVVIVPARTNMSSAELGTDDVVVQKVFLPGQSTEVSFTVSTDKPWASVTPSNGTLPTTGIELTIDIDQSQIGAGTNMFTLSVAYTTPSSARGAQSNATILTPIPVSVSLVTPVVPSGKGTPSPDSLIFSAVGHAPGQNDSLFESDVRVTNLSAQTMKYSVYYTPSGTDGTVSSSSTNIEIAPNQTLALDDIISTVFGIGTTSGSIGMLEVRPLTTSTSSGGFFSTISPTAQKLLTLGSSRTYNFTPTGTFGQFVPAIPYSQFVGLGKILSLQQVAQSTAYRANFGFLEASGQPVDLSMRVYDVIGNLIATIPISLGASEHKQIGLLLAANGVTDLEDGRVEIEVTGGSGKVTAYVAEVDNGTNDPSLVSAVEKGAVSTNRFIVPGMAHKDLGFAFWVSDLRIFNAGTKQIPATLTFYAEANPSSFVSKQVTIDPGEIEVLNDVVQNLFQQPNGAGGSIVITTDENAPLSVTARTYNKTTTGTFGQFIPGVTVADSVGAGDRALQILQIEQSSRFRTYVVLNETTGKPVHVEVSLTLPDSIVTPVVSYDLAGNEYRQISIGDFDIGDAIYNARVSVKVTSGSGKITASGSSIDMATNDPTYIMAQ